MGKKFEHMSDAEAMAYNTKAVNDSRGRTGRFDTRFSDYFSNRTPVRKPGADGFKESDNLA